MPKNYHSNFDKNLLFFFVVFNSMKMSTIKCLNLRDLKLKYRESCLAFSFCATLVHVIKNNTFFIIVLFTKKKK